MYRNKRLGIDVGSTTVKIVVINEKDEIIFTDYKRHFADIQNTLTEMIKKAVAQLGNILVSAAITGSGGLTLGKYLGLPFVQEVIAVTKALKQYASDTDVAIELGGEDAKIIYFTNGIEQRMNGVCAGGTGSFIDQMASLLKTDAAGLNEYAKTYQTIYPIAARCGVFAKSDIQSLINEGVTESDLAASIFQAVVNQTISGLACGKPIRGNIAFLGGPLCFLSQLKIAFVRSLQLTKSHIIAPPNAHLFAAIGAASSPSDLPEVSFTDLVNMLSGGFEIPFEDQRLQPLFNHAAEYQLFRQRHSQHCIHKNKLSEYQGNCYLGIDAGSTTTKLALIGEDGALLYSFYQNNHGSPINTTRQALKALYKDLPEKVKIVRSCATGYGEDLLKAAFILDEGKVETIAHYYAARFFEPEVDAIFDIGGQDMKFIKIKNNTVDSVLLNEACSSGCGSFIETFAQSLNYKIESFSKLALTSKHPVDLGTRCTVFMNSKVKQFQKEGATVGDISAGLAYSVIKNALFKVIKLTNLEELGKKIVVQGGTFCNDAVLKSFETITGCEAIRPDIAGIMGAFGAALIARENDAGGESSILSRNQIDRLRIQTETSHCQGCTNECLLTISTFSGERKHITGNRCERGLGITTKRQQAPNLYEYKLKRYFSYPVLPSDQAKRGKVGIPRVLNIYENYPFWHTFFTMLEYQVILSPLSNHRIYELGIESIPSESECYPAKLAHGHMQWLINQGITYIFYPCIPYERKEFIDANDHYNCPMVTSYPENIGNNMEDLKNTQTIFEKPFLSFESKKILKNRLLELFSAEKKIPKEQVKAAVDAGWDELLNARTDLYKKGEETIAYLKATGGTGIVLSGRPYHIDPEINHCLPELINSYDVAVLTEDSISHLSQVDRPTLVLDQWMYHSRLYAAATYVSGQPNLELVQLNSFGCGLDAIATDQVNEILQKSDKLNTVIKIDEINNIAAARIRIRSLLAVIKQRKNMQEGQPKPDMAHNRVVFTKAMKANYTILAPQMSPIHFDFLEPVFRTCGYHFEFLSNVDQKVIDIGLKYVNNDACYPSIIVVGLVLDALFSGKYDLDKTAVMMQQTGGGCRASNYIGFIRRALTNAGLSQIPVISLNPIGLEKNPGFKLSPKLIWNGLQALIYGDILMRVLYKTRPYEEIPNSANDLYEKWRTICIASLQRRNPWMAYKANIQGIIRDFDKLALKKNIKKPQVGIVGEIFIKYLPAANNDLVDFLEAEGVEVVVPDILNFFTYCCYDYVFNARYLGKKKSAAMIGNVSIRGLERLRKPAIEALSKSSRFVPPADLDELIQYAEPIISVGNHTGEGWFLTAEMCELIQSGTNNIICVQPFACLPNHIAGKGVLKEMRKRYSEANIVAVDYDSGSSQVNQVNRIKLLLTNAFENI